MKPILIVRTDVSAKDKEKLTKEGYLVIVSDRTDAVHPAPQPEIRLDTSMTFTTCISCAERIYMSKERVANLRLHKNSFYCSQGHSQFYK